MTLASPDDEKTKLIGGTVMFLPWLRLSGPEQVGRIRFVPLRSERKIDPIFAEIEGALTTILSSYRDIDGTAIDNAVIISVADRNEKPWDIRETDFAEIGWAADQLFIAAFASNEYLDRGLSPYVNSAMFEVLGQRFSTRGPVYVGLTTRRRDGNAMDGGYKHGEISIARPLQVSLREAAKIDRGLLSALNSATNAKSVTADRLRTALPFFLLGNTDSASMTPLPEAILIVSAYEQLLHSGKEGTALALATAFGSLFQQHGSVRVIDAKATRPDIEVESKEEEQWFVHQKWAQELHTLRSKAAHRGHAKMRDWGWNFTEHLLMAAWVFPLALKLLLEKVGHYQLTDNDRSHCHAIDEILTAKEWSASADEDFGPSVWNHNVQQARLSMLTKKAWDYYQAKTKKEPHPVGDVVHYYAKHKAAVVKLVAKVTIGQRLLFIRSDQSFEQEVQSLQLNGESVSAGAVDDEIGIEVDQPVREGWTVFRVAEPESE